LGGEGNADFKKQQLLISFLRGRPIKIVQEKPATPLRSKSTLPNKITGKNKKEGPRGTYHECTSPKKYISLPTLAIRLQGTPTGKGKRTTTKVAGPETFGAGLIALRVLREGGTEGSKGDGRGKVQRAKGFGSGQKQEAGPERPWKDGGGDPSGRRQRNMSTRRTGQKEKPTSTNLQETSIGGKRLPPSLAPRRRIKNFERGREKKQAAQDGPV